jgi:HD-like signal output (HDOD) protein
MIEIDLLKWTQSTISQNANGFLPPADMQRSINQVKELPPLPATANRILQLASDPLADAKKLAEIIELDPLLSIQVIRWASSPLYGYRGKINSVQDAIAKVLGFDYVLNLTFGLATLSPLKTPVDGIIGTQSLWIQALASTKLMPIIAQKMPVDIRPASEQLFLAGLIHNIGFLLLGDQFSDEYAYLNKLINTNPTLSINSIENFAFGIDHSQLGAWLMQSWSMPKPILDVVYHHHNPHYRGKNYRLNLLVYLNDYLLGKMGIGDAMNQQCPDTVFEQLNIIEKDCIEIMKQLSQNIDDIKTTVDSLLS